MKKLMAVGVVIFSIIFFSSLINDHYHTNIQQDAVIKGQMTIEGIDQQHAFALDGEWEFYRDRLIDPTNFVELEADAIDFLRVPQLWEESTGAATYRMFFDLDLKEIEDQGRLAIKMPYVYSAYQLWLNGHEISSNGKVGLSSSEEKVTREPKVVMISPSNGKNEMVLQITNHHFYRGGISKSISLGPAEYLFNLREKQIVIDIFMAGSFFIAGFLFFLLYLKRREEKAALYFALISFLLLFRTLLSNEVYLSQIINHFNWAIGNRIEAGLIYVGLPLVLLLLSELYKNYFTLRFIYGWKLFSLIGLAIVVLFPHRLYDGLLIYLYIIMLVYAMYIYVAFMKYFDRSLPDFYVLATAKFVLLFYCIHDLLVTYGVIVASFKIQIGMYIFMLSLAYALVLHLAREFGKVESLVIQNENMLAEISKMNQELERVVEKRTKELETSNKKLYELSMVDGLTKVPNRLQFDKQLNNFLVQASNKGLPLSILFLDIDFFKSYNDNYGHIQGDKALKDIAWALYEKIECDDNTFMARYGGEEFVVIYLNKDAEETQRIAEELRNMIFEMGIPHEFSLIEEVITISIGGISIIPDQDDQANNLLDKADKALYKAKNEGRNRVSMWE